MGARLALVLLSAAFAAQAGLTIRSSSGKDADAPRDVYVDGNRLRMENGKHVFIFDGDKRELIVADTEERTFSVTTEARMKAMGERVRQHLAAAKAQMAKLPPAQRKMLEEHQPGHAQQPAQYDRLGQSKRVAGYACEMYRVTWAAGTAPQQGCFIPWGGKVRKEDLHAFKLFGDFLGQMTAGMGLGDESRRNMFADMPGVPALILDEDGAVKQELKSIEHGSISADKFAAPAGYTRKERSAFGE